MHCLLIEDLLRIFKLSARIVLLIFSFLSDRQFIIQLGQYRSTTYFDNRGIGQGTVNGPALYILFFNKVAGVLRDCKFLAFADDLVIYFEATNLEAACERMQVILTRLDVWCNSVGLPVSFSKTRFMISRKSGAKPSTEIVNISVNNNVVERVSTFKYLGLYFDEYLTYKRHFDHVYKKISVNAGLICKIRKNIAPNVLTLINAYINCLIDYSLIVWGATRQNDFDRLQRVTRKIQSGT